jgi:hypothetical protein
LRSKYGGTGKSINSQEGNMNQSKFLKKFAVSLICATGLASGAALATPIAVGTVYTFNSFSAFDPGTPPAPSGNAPYATVTLTQTSSALVSVDVKLASGYFFAGTGGGNGNTFAFNVFNNNAQVNYSGTDFIWVNTPFTEHGYTFTDGLDLTSGGTSDKVTGPLDFTVTVAGVSLADFADVSGKYTFGIDIGNSNGVTGDIFFSGLPTTQPPTDSNGNPLPEPASLALMGMGLFGVISMRKRNKM